jgi:hypothetical protein
VRCGLAALKPGCDLAQAVKEFIFHTELWLPRPRDEVFAFFADAYNLQTITPPWLNFEVLTPEPITMRPGALIDYRIRVHGWPIR